MSAFSPAQSSLLYMASLSGHKILNICPVKATPITLASTATASTCSCFQDMLNFILQGRYLQNSLLLILTFPHLLPSPCPSNPLCHPQEKKYLQTYSFTKKTNPTEHLLAIDFLVTACWLKTNTNSTVHYIVQFTWLLLLKPTWCLCSRASSLLPATAQINHPVTGKELSKVMSAS